MTTIHSSTLAPPANILADLRALAVKPPASIADAFEAAECQAQLLRDLLPGRVDKIAARLTDLIPTIRIDQVEDMPAAGISFWGHGQWHIHVQASAPIDVQQLTLLHELKHIIDHPLRRQHPNLINNIGWEIVAYHFAVSVLAYEPNPTSIGGAG